MILAFSNTYMVSVQSVPGMEDTIVSKRDNLDCQLACNVWWVQFGCESNASDMPGGCHGAGRRYEWHWYWCTE